MGGTVDARLDYYEYTVDPDRVPAYERTLLQNQLVRASFTPRGDGLYSVAPLSLGIHWRGPC